MSLSTQGSDIEWQPEKECKPSSKDYSALTYLILYMCVCTHYQWRYSFIYLFIDMYTHIHIYEVIIVKVSVCGNIPIVSGTHEIKPIPHPIIPETCLEKDR